MVITDGEENASHQFTKARVKEMIDHQTGKYNWKFIYLGANQDAFAEAGAVGIPMSTAANYAAARLQVAFAGTSANVASYRRSGRAASLEYSDDQREEMVNPEEPEDKEE